MMSKHLLTIEKLRVLVTVFTSTKYKFIKRTKKFKDAACKGELNSISNRLFRMLPDIPIQVTTEINS